MANRIPQANTSARLEKGQKQMDERKAKAEDGRGEIMPTEEGKTTESGIGGI